MNLSTVDLSASPDTPGRVDSFFNNPNTFAQILVLLLPLSCALFLSATAGGGPRPWPASPCWWGVGPC